MFFFYFFAKINTTFIRQVKKNGKVFPGCTIILTDKNKKELLNLPDAFEDMKEGTPAAEAQNITSTT